VASKTSPRRINETEKARKALSLRRSGLDFDAIAKKVGYTNRSGAWKAVCRLLEERARETAADADHIRAVEIERLDALLLAIWGEATRGDPALIDRVLRIMDRRAKLLGLDAPTKQEVSGPDGNAIALQLEARERLVGRIAGIVERAAAQRDPFESE